MNVMPLGEGADLMPENGCSMAEAPETTGPGVGGSRPRPDRHARPVGRKTGPAGEETGMTRPLVFIDFDGVINQFPDDKVIRRQGRTDWLKRHSMWTNNPPVPYGIGGFFISNLA